MIKYAHNEYALIDCFRNPDTKNPIVSDYFEKIKEPLNKINRIIVTHWHQDHIAGISEIIPLASEELKIVLNPIIKDDDFLEFISLNDKLKNESTKEFVKVMNLIKPGENLLLASNNKIICESSNNCIKALSPQDAEVWNYISSMKSKLLNKEVAYDIPDSNDLSLALLFKWGDNGILLGGRLRK